MRGTPHALVCSLAAGLLAAGCAAPSGPSIDADDPVPAASSAPTPEVTSSPPSAAEPETEDRARERIGSDSTDGPDGSGTAPEGLTSARDTDGPDGGGTTPKGSPAARDTAGSAPGSGTGGGTSSRTRAREGTGPSAAGSATSRAPRSRERTSSPTSRSAGPTTRPAPLNIAPFNLVTGESWNTLEQRFRETIARACGRHGAECVTLAEVFRDDPQYFVPDDCVLRDVDQPEQAFTGDTITVYIEDECGDGDPPPNLDSPDTSGLSGMAWAQAQALLAERITAVCGEHGPGCLTVTTAVQADPAGPGAVDCAFRFVNVPTYLHADDRPQTPEPDDVLQVLLNEPCSTG